LAASGSGFSTGGIVLSFTLSSSASVGWLIRIFLLCAKDIVNYGQASFK